MKGSRGIVRGKSDNDRMLESRTFTGIAGLTKG